MDADRKCYTFNNWYKPMYNSQNSIISILFDFDAIDDKNGVICIKKNLNCQYLKEKGVKEDRIKKIMDFIEKNEKLKSKGFLPFRLSGDADYELRDENKVKQPQMHMFPNFSLFPVTGGLQRLKSDRPLKSFLSENLQKYFLNREIQYLPYMKGKSYKDKEKDKELVVCEKKVLKAFFDIFNSLDDYCYNIYFLYYEDIKNLDINEYWNRRIEIAKKCNISEEIMNQDIDSQEYV